MIFRASAAALVLAGVLASSALAQAAESPHASAEGHGSLADNRLTWPSREQLVRVLTMRDYNTRVVLLGTTILGISAGAVGAFMLLRKQSLMGDVVSHASLPGIAVTFILLEAIRPGAGRSLPALLVGAAVAGLLGVVCTATITRLTRIKEDAALAIVLSVFFGLGIALFTVIQKIPSGNAAGLHHFIFGKAASMVADDVQLIGGAALVALVLCGLLFKEFSLVAFDEDFAAAQGWPVFRIDLVLMALVVGVTVIGLQSVGLLLVVAMLILPAVAARFWTDHLPRMVVASAILGGASAYAGVVASALFPRLSAGAVIVLAAAAAFVFSMLFGIRQGVVQRMLMIRGVRERVGRHDLLRAMFEWVETQASADPARRQKLNASGVPLAELVNMRSWSAPRLKSLVAKARREGLVTVDADRRVRFTEPGALDAERIVRNHRLWELYLIHYAQIAPSHVDRDADLIEHVLDPQMIGELEALLASGVPAATPPPSPHQIEPPSTSETPSAIATGSRP